MQRTGSTSSAHAVCVCIQQTCGSLVFTPSRAASVFPCFCNQAVSDVSLSVLLVCVLVVNINWKDLKHSSAAAKLLPGGILAIYFPPPPFQFQ